MQSEIRIIIFLQTDPLGTDVQAIIILLHGIDLKVVILAQIPIINYPGSNTASNYKKKKKQYRTSTNASTLTCLLPEFSVVLDRNIASLLKLKGWVYGELLAGKLPERSSVSLLPWVGLPLEHLVTLLSTQKERLWGETSEFGS